MSVGCDSVLLKSKQHSGFLRVVLKQSFVFLLSQIARYRTLAQPFTP